MEMKPSRLVETRRWKSSDGVIGEGLGEEYPRVVDQGVYRAECADGGFRYSCRGSGFPNISIDQGQLR